ncbi:MAG: nucleotidyltransferase domain-containing protein [Chlamydiae bacterium]|nr:nucleotidyltransferase domain-containing protein [Chlamydiota bacterium]MBI3276289.1 nucleotidyltransferase domain-containing protein [Chlamydiota bacterium]
MKLLKDPILNQFQNRLEKYKKKIDTVYLFGSRARGDERPDSDYDLLVVVPATDLKLREKLYGIAWDILLKTGRVISFKFIQKKEFDHLSKIPTPFMENLQREGIKIG